MYVCSHRRTKCHVVALESYSLRSCSLVLQVLPRNTGVKTGTTSSVRRARPRDGRPAAIGAAVRDVRPGGSTVEQSLLVHQLHTFHGVSIAWQRVRQHVILRVGMWGTWPTTGRGALGWHTQAAEDSVQHAASSHTATSATRPPHYAQLWGAFVAGFQGPGPAAAATQLERGAQRRCLPGARRSVSSS